MPALNVTHDDRPPMSARGRGLYDAFSIRTEDVKAVQPDGPICPQCKESVIYPGICQKCRSNLPAVLAIQARDGAQ